jgi:hypothetical protein
MWAFDLIELNGDDVRRDPLAVRKATLERMLARTASGIRFNEHLDGKMVHSSFTMPASSGWKASCPNGATRLMLLAARRTGSSRRTPRRPL